MRERRTQFGAGSSMERRWFERWFLLNRKVNAAISCMGKAALTCMVWPRFVAPHRWKLTRHEMPLSVRRGGGLEGYRILHLTDLHAGRTDEKYLMRVVRRCLEEKPDLVAITGDLIDYEPESLEPIGRILRELAGARVPDGVVAIFGNHDYHEYSWRKTGKRSARRSVQRRLVKLVAESGVRLLRNEKIAIERGGERMWVVGLDEMWADLADAEKAFDGVRAGEACVCLQHNPDGVEFLRGYPWEYMLTGHSHGGQAVLPGVGALYVPMEHRKYLRGKFGFEKVAGQGVGERVMFVSTGLGYSTAIRMFCAPEATIFTVVSGGTGTTESQRHRGRTEGL